MVEQAPSFNKEKDIALSHIQRGIANYINEFLDKVERGGSIDQERTDLFFQNTIFEMAKHGFPFSFKEDFYHTAFLDQFTENYLKFVVNKEGNKKDFFLWKTLAETLLRDCLQPEEIEHLLSEIDTEYRINRSFKTENPLSEKEREELKYVGNVLGGFQLVVMDQEINLDLPENSPNTPIAEGRKIIAPFRRKTPSEMICAGEVEQKILNMLAPLFAQGQDEVDVSPESLKQSIYEIITLAIRNNFQFDFAEDKYHRAFLSAFVDGYEQCVVKNKSAESCFQESFFWKDMAGFLVKSCPDLQYDELEETLIMLESEIEKIENLEGDYTREQVQTLEDLKEVFENFQTIVLTNILQPEEKKTRFLFKTPQPVLQ